MPLPKSSLPLLFGTGILLAACALARAPQGQQAPSAKPVESQEAIADRDWLSRQQPTGLGGGERGPGVPNFWVRKGFRVEKVADLKRARFLEFDDRGRLIVSRPQEGDLTLFTKQADGSYGNPTTLVSDLPSVHGLQFYKGTLWYTTQDSVRTLKIAADGRATDRRTILEGLPGGGHFWRPILVTDTGFYTEVGDSGNINDETNTDRQKVWFYSLDGKTRKLFASGFRNTEKLRFRPGTTEIYGADNGSDWYGKAVGDRQGRQPVTDLNPPDELNRIVEGGFYGHPFVVGDRTPRYEFKDRPDINDLAAKTIPPIWKFGPHWAALGFTFLQKSGLDPSWDGDLVAAIHGSWNDSIKVGYRLERVMFDPETGLPIGSMMLVGTLDGQKPLARPVDVVQEPGGGLLWSDDAGGAIYRLSRAK